MTPKIRLQVLTDKEYRPIEGDFIIRMTLKLGVSDTAEVLPLNLCLLIDKSISMAEQGRLEKARESACELIRELEEGDFLTLISFGSGVEVLAEQVPITTTSRRLALEAVQGLHAGGATRLDLALAKAIDIVSRNTADHMNALLVLSDGTPTDSGGYMLPPEEQTAMSRAIAEAFGQHKITTSTIGLGDAADCPAEFLEECAEKGGGIFYHADQSGNLRDRFFEAFQRVKSMAVSDATFEISNLHGSVRRATAVYPDIRELALPEAGTSWSIEAGSLQRGEEHAFLIEIVTPCGDPGRRKLCDVSVSYRMDGVRQTLAGAMPLIEYTEEESLLSKQGHPEVERYKGMLTAFIQTRRANQMLRSDADPGKTRVLLQSAAKTTRRLGMSRQTRLLEDMAQRLEDGQSVSANELTAVAVASRKTRILEI